MATNQYFIVNEIKQGYKDGFYISEIVYGDGLWAVVMSKTAVIENQFYVYDSSFPEETVDEKLIQAQSDRIANSAEEITVEMLTTLKLEDVLKVTETLSGGNTGPSGSSKGGQGRT